MVRVVCFFYEIAKEKAKASGIPFYDYSQDSFFLQRCQLFDDTVHLNYSGAKFFTGKLAADIKNSIRLK